MESETPKSPDKSSFGQTILVMAGTAVITYLISGPFNKANRSDSDFINKVGEHDSRIQNLERFQERTDERMLNVKASVDEIKKTQHEMLDEIRKSKK